VTPAEPVVVAVKKTWVPTRKWFYAQAIALGGLATSAIQSGWDETESVLAVGIVVQAIVTYVLPNEDTPGGVPVKPL
jgi:hypothetical protein